MTVVNVLLLYLDGRGRCCGRPMMVYDHGDDPASTADDDVMGVEDDGEMMECVDGSM